METTNSYRKLKVELCLRVCVRQLGIDAADPRVAEAWAQSLQLVREGMGPREAVDAAIVPIFRVHAISAPPRRVLRRRMRRMA